jgi:hypothetical protein
MDIMRDGKPGRPCVWMRRLCIFAGILLILIGVYLGIAGKSIGELSEDASQEQDSSYILLESRPAYNN